MRQTIKLQKRGNSIALCIPKAFAEKMNLQPNSPIELVIDGNKLMVVPVTEPVFSLDELLAGVTEDSRHDEVDAGAAAGNEAW